MMRLASPPESQTTWLCCGVLQDEMRALAQEGLIRGRLVFTDSRLHMEPQRLERVLTEHLAAMPGDVVLVFGDCCATMADLESGPHIGRIQAINCVEMVVGREMYRSLRRNGAFVLLPEWAGRWREIFARELGLDHKTAQDLMAESHRELVYLDTDVTPVPAQDLDDCSDYVGLPWRVLETDLQCLLRGLHEAERRLHARNS